MFCGCNLSTFYLLNISGMRAFCTLLASYRLCYQYSSGEHTCQNMSQVVAVPGNMSEEVVTPQHGF